MIVYQGLRRNDGTRAAQVVLVVYLDDASLLRQIGREPPRRTSAPTTTDGKGSVDEVEVELPHQPRVIGLNDPIDLHHNAVGRQLLRGRGGKPDLMMEGS